MSRGDALGEALPVADDERVVEIIPAAQCIVRTVELPGLADLQARGAARVALAEVSLLPIEALHVAAGNPDADGRRIVVGVSASDLTTLLAVLADSGLDPDHVVAAPLIPRRPESGFVRADLGSETVVRGTETAFADDPVLTPLLVRDAPLVTLDRTALEAALVAAVEFPEADLRHGVFAKRARWAVDAVHMRRYAMMALVIGILVLASQIVTIIRLNARASSVEAATQVEAAAVLPPGTIITDPVAQSEARLASMQGAGAGFAPMAAAMGAAINTTPGTELGALVFDGTGGLRATVRAASTADLDAVSARLVSSGLRVESGPLVAGQGHPYRDITVQTR